MNDAITCSQTNCSGFKSHVVCSRKNNLPVMDIRSADEFEGDDTAILTKPILLIGIRA